MMRALFTLLLREWRLFFSNKIMLILYLGGPLLYGLIFHMVYKKGKVTDLPVVVVDRDGTQLSRRLIDMIDDNDVTMVKSVLHESVQLDRLFLTGATYAVVEVPYRFQADVIQRRQPEVLVYINNTDLLPSGYVNRSLALVTGTLNTMLAAGEGRAVDAFRINTFKLFNPSANYGRYIWPSYLGIVLQSVVMVVLALSFAGEFEQHTAYDLYTQARGSATLILLGKLLPYIILSAITLVTYHSYFLIFRQPPPDDIAGSLLISLLFVCCSGLLGAITGILFKKQLPCLQFLMALSMPIYIASGFSWPFEDTGIPSRIFSGLFPFMAFVNGWRILLVEHGRLADIRDYLVIQMAQMLFYLVILQLLLHRHIHKITRYGKDRHHWRRIRRTEPGSSPGH